MRLPLSCFSRLLLFCTALFYCQVPAFALTTQPAGGGQAFSNEQPSLVLNYIVNISASDYDNLGEVGMFAGTFAPAGWAIAEGQELPISNYPALFSKLGTAFGGDGENTFSLPDLRGRTAIGTGQAPGLPYYTLGQQVGGEQVTLDYVPEHAHDFGTNYTTATAGQTVAHSNMQPSLALTPVIAMTGIYPSQSLSALGDSDVAAFGVGNEPLLAEVTWLAHDDIPEGWHVADGTVLSIQHNQALFSLLGTTYGGNGETDFALPDLRGRTAVGEGNGPGLTDRRLGNVFGTYEETLTAMQMPSHTHDLPYGPSPTEASGNNSPQSNLQPSLALTHLVATQGIFPSESSSAGQVADEQIAALGSGTEPFLASVSMFAGNFAPRGFISAEGQTLTVSSNSALFAILWDRFGGDFMNNQFDMPDLRGRATVGVGQGIGLSLREFADQYGVESSVLDETHLPPHVHNITPLDGDFDFDGDVDGNDFLLWQRGESPDPLSTADLTAWQDSYGDTNALAASSSIVPEPTSAMLLIFSCCTLGLCRTRAASTRFRC